MRFPHFGVHVSGEFLQIFIGRFLGLERLGLANFDPFGGQVITPHFLGLVRRQVESLDEFVELLLHLVGRRLRRNVRRHIGRPTPMRRRTGAHGAFR